MKIDNSNITFYLNKFFEGDTTREEEIALSTYFRSTERFPSGVREYKPMFEWIDKGMPENYDPVIKPLNNHGRMVKRIISVAAAIGIIVVVTTMIIENSFLAKAEKIYAGSYVCHSGMENKDIKIIIPEIQNMIREVDAMEEKIDNIDFDVTMNEIEDEIMTLGDIDFDGVMDKTEKELKI